MKALRIYNYWNYQEYKEGDELLHIFDKEDITTDEIIKWIQDNEIELFDKYNTSVTLCEPEDDEDEDEISYIHVCTDSFEEEIEIIEI